jgi:hypothetical protein
MKTATLRREQGFRFRSGFGLEEAELAALFRLPQSPRLCRGERLFVRIAARKKFSAAKDLDLICCSGVSVF